MRPNLPKIKKTLHQNIFLLNDVEARLRRSNIPSAASEAEQLVRHFSGLNRVEFFTGQKAISSRARKSVEAALKARAQGKPLTYVLKETEFFGFKIFVSPETLIPRPETEVLVEEALTILNTYFPTAAQRKRKTTRPEVLELGTGSGCIAVSLTIHRSNCRMTALDISSKALKTAHKNINFYQLDKKVRLIRSDLFSVFGKSKRAFWDLIISNPPYVPSEDFTGLSKEVLSEPRMALNGGPGGLSMIHRILEQAPDYMKKNAWLLIEIGDGQAGPLVEKIAKEKKFANCRFVKDLNGIDRVLVAQKWTS